MNFIFFEDDLYYSIELDYNKKTKTYKKDILKPSYDIIDLIIMFDS